MLCQTQSQREGFLERLRNDPEHIQTKNWETKATQEDKEQKDKVQIISQGLGNKWLLEMMIRAFMVLGVQTFKISFDFKMIFLLYMSSDWSRITDLQEIS